MNKFKINKQTFTDFFHNYYHPIYSIVIGVVIVESAISAILGHFDIGGYTVPISRRTIAGLTVVALGSFIFYFFTKPHQQSILQDSEEYESASHGEVLLSLIVEAVVLLFACWQLSYMLGLLLHFPAYLIYIPFSLLSLGVGWLFMPFWKKKLQVSSTGNSYLFKLLAVGVAAGFLVLFLYGKPSCDDIQFFHRALLQVEHLNEPFIINDVIHELPLPRTFQGYLPGYEFFVTMNTNLLGINPLDGLYTGSVLASVLLVVIIYGLIFREFGFSQHTALLATGLILIFFIYDGNTHRATGTFSITRLWQGKGFSIAVVPPAIILFGYRFLKKSSTHHFLLLFMLNVFWIGLTGSGLFLGPAMMISLSIAYLLNTPLSVKAFKHAFMMGMASILSITLLLLIMLDILPTYGLVDQFSSWPSTWINNLRLVMRPDLIFLRNAIILFIIPLVILPRRIARFLILYSGVFISLFINPLTGPIFLKLVSPGAYWRLAYLFPLPLTAGLLICILDDWKNIRVQPFTWQNISRILTILLVITVSAFSYEKSNLEKTATSFRYPLSQIEYEFSQDVSQDIEGKHLLMPGSLVCVSPLITPDISLEVARAFQTQQEFARIDQEDEGFRRSQLRHIISTCEELSDEELVILNTSIDRVDGIIFRSCFQKYETGQEIIEQLLADNWEIRYQTDNYFLVIRSP